ncbi:hypothetical protein [Flavobacterium succinicans]|uniref:Lipocalin-like domain-containing protein n=1 Tax=Flavobacterium succinicans TaxID=29536 RepID=A0A199XQM2_9FLAO|nr:hypothetical protein [Flavobacterium succinicans]OAZ03945.1 hypothetical protein FLB_16340 [Flavobacterium succinicans]
MKKQYFLFILLWSLGTSFGQELIQEASVKRAYVGNDGEFQDASFATPINVFSNRQGYLKIIGAEFLTKFSGDKAKLEEYTAYNSAELNSQTLVTSKNEKNGLVTTTFKGKLVYKTIDGVYAPDVSVVFTINQADILRLKISNSKNSIEYILDLQIK